MGTYKGLILFVSFSVIVWNIFIALVVRLVQRLTKAFPEKFDESLMRGAIFIQAFESEATEIVSETPKALKHDLIFRPIL